MRRNSKVGIRDANVSFSNIYEVYKQKEPRGFDYECTEWSDYLIYFLRVAKWNGWNDEEMTDQLIMSFEGASMKLLSMIPEDENSFQELVHSLNNIFYPRERAEVWKMQFKTRMLNKNESFLNLAEDLKKLASRGYYKLSAESLEILVLDQFIEALKHNDKLQEHVFFMHPRNVGEAVSYSIEYDAFQKKKYTCVQSTQACEIPKNVFDQLKCELINEVLMSFRQHEICSSIAEYKLANSDTVTEPEKCASYGEIETKSVVEKRNEMHGRNCFVQQCDSNNIEKYKVDFENVDRGEKSEDVVTMTA